MKTFLLLAALALVGCSNPYKNYHAMPGITPRQVSESIQVAIVRDGKEAVATYEQRGFTKIGSAWFTSSRAPSRGKAIRKAREVGAEQVVIGIVSQEVISDVVPLVTYVPGQTYNTTFNGNAYQRGSETTHFNGYATTTTRPQLETQYVPVTRKMTTYEAVFMRRSTAPQ